MNTKLSTVFFGSGPVALKSLQLLVKNFDLEAIITKPATEEVMQQAFPNTRVFTAKRRADLDTLCAEQKFQSKFGIVIDFGVIIDQDAIDSFPLGIINSHFSLLPEWRGVDPITFAVLSGQKETGVSLMRVVRAWDEGPLLAQAPFTIPAGMTTPQLTDALIQISDVLLKEIVPIYFNGDIEPLDQLLSTIGPKEASYSRKITREDGAIDWTKPAEVLEREIRAYIDWPHSYTVLAGKETIITSAQVVDLQGKPGTLESSKQHLYVHCGKQSLEILSLKPVGKPEMPISAFLAGYRRLLGD